MPGDLTTSGVRRNAEQRGTKLEVSDFCCNDTGDPHAAGGIVPDVSAPERGAHTRQQLALHAQQKVRATKTRCMILYARAEVGLFS
jgi:hypothetical protein